MFTKNKTNPKTDTMFNKLEKKDPAITEANFDEFRQFTPTLVKRLVKIIQTNPHITSLSLLNCNLSQKEARRIAEAVTKNSHITSFAMELFEDDDNKTKTRIENAKKHTTKNAQSAHQPRK